MKEVFRGDKQEKFPRKDHPIVRNPTTLDGEHTLQLHPVTERIFVCAAPRFLIRERKTDVGLGLPIVISGSDRR